MSNPNMTQHQTETFITIQHFNEAFNAHDLDGVMALMTLDCIFENTYPAPSGTRHTGHLQVRKAFEQFFQSSPHAKFTFEEMFACGDRAVVRWIYQWVDERNETGYVRGVDVFRVQDGKVAEKLSYVKG